MASATTYFAPVDTLAINTLLSLSGPGANLWLIQSNAPTKSKDIAKGLNATGDVSATKLHNSRESRTLVYECQGDSGVLTIPKAGQVTSTGIHIDSVKVDYGNAKWPTMTIVTHKHLGAASHTTSSCRTYTKTIALPAQFGVPETINDLATPTPEAQFALDSAAVAMRSLSYSLGCTHVDEPGAAGDWHSGENRAGLEQIDVEFLGVPDDADIDVAADWNDPSDGEGATNQGASNRRRSWQRDVLKD
jgi:hypothetical protein